MQGGELELLQRSQHGFQVPLDLEVTSGIRLAQGQVQRRGEPLEEAWVDRHRGLCLLGSGQKVFSHAYRKSPLAGKEFLQQPQR